MFVLSCTIGLFTVDFGSLFRLFFLWYELLFYKPNIYFVHLFIIRVLLLLRLLTT